MYKPIFLWHKHNIWYLWCASEKFCTVLCVQIEKNLTKSMRENTRHCDLRMSQINETSILEEESHLSMLTERHACSDSWRYCLFWREREWEKRGGRGTWLHLHNMVFFILSASLYRLSKLLPLFLKTFWRSFLSNVSLINSFITIFHEASNYLVSRIVSRCFRSVTFG